MSEIEQHKYYKQAYSAYYGTSFSPEKRAVMQCNYYDTICQELRDLGKESAIDRFTSLFLKSMAAKSRCVSPMIAGPSNFPVARMEKYNRWEHTATQAMIDFVEKLRKPPTAPRHELDYKIEEKEYMIGGVKVRQNTDENRLQFFFDGKPEAEMIAKLKKTGFKWSPRNKAWQRQLTPNALMVVDYVLSRKATP